MTCTHGMPSPGSCIDCMDEGNLPAPPRDPAPTVEAVFAAKFAGHCPGCNLPVHEGQRIARMSSGVYLHERCAA